MLKTLFEIKIKRILFHFVGDEKKVIEKLKLIKNNDLSILLHPFFFFKDSCTQKILIVF